MFSPLKKLLFIIAGLIICLVLGIVLALRPLLIRLKYNAQKMGAQEKVVSFFQAQNKKLQQAAAVYSSSRLVSEQVKDVFVNPEAPLSFIEFLENTAKQQGLELHLIPKSRPELKPWPGINFSVKVSGPFPACARFLAQIETAPFLIEISQVNINRINEEQVKRNKKAKALSVGDTSLSISLNVAAAEMQAEEPSSKDKK